jgi:three-Cys-motif partner protein
MASSSFFEESTEQSQVKANIVAKYFSAWAKVIIPSAKKKGCNIAYIDLFSGPGLYQDGSKSTPLLILERAISEPDMSEMLITIFNDKDVNNIKALQQSINSLPNIISLNHQPILLNKEVGDEIFKLKEFQTIGLIPRLFFIDPWGYKELSINLIASTIINWGCDCIFFFNYNRINMGLGNKAVEEHMDSLFSKERADILRNTLQSMESSERELNILEAICQVLKDKGGTYSLPFTFKNSVGNRTSHHLIFVSKNVLGYKIMKEIMAKESSTQQQGVASFDYNPATIRQPLLFEYSQPLEQLENKLIDELAGKTLTMQEIYQQHNIGKPYIEKNYKDVLLKLESEGKITAKPAKNKRRKNTFGDNVLVTFPQIQ